MKTAAILILLCFFNTTLLWPQTSTSEFRWIDGYLEKDYIHPAAVDEVDGIPGMFDKCVAVQTIILQNGSGYIRVNGVGDSTGHWRNWSGVGTFKNLGIPDGGMLVYVKIKGNTIGFKVGGKYSIPPFRLKESIRDRKLVEGDRHSSEILHGILEERIATIEQRFKPLSEEQIRRVSEIRETFAFTDPPPLDSYIWRYRRAKDPESVISIHAAMAHTLTTYARGKNLSIDAKKELLKIIEQGVNSSPDQAIRNLTLKEFTESQAREILDILAKALPTK